jgi:hypothetical protein
MPRQADPLCSHSLLSLLLALSGLLLCVLLRQQRSDNHLEAVEVERHGEGSELAAAPLPPPPHFHAVLLVLASTNAPFYLFCRSAWLALAEAALQQGVRVVLLYGSGALSVEEETPWDLAVNFSDSAEVWGGAPVDLHIINKTLMALPILLERYTFDYLVRTNIHTFWDARRLVGKLSALPSSGCLAGHKMNWMKNLSFVNGIDFIISADLVQPMLDAVPQTNVLAFAEDIAMSVLVHGVLQVPILDAWYGEPGGKGPLLYFPSHDITREAVCA